MTSTGRAGATVSRAAVRDTKVGTGAGEIAGGHRREREEPDGVALHSRCTPVEQVLAIVRQVRSRVSSPMWIAYVRPSATTTAASRRPTDASCSISCDDSFERGRRISEPTDLEELTAAPTFPEPKAPTAGGCSGRQSLARPHRPATPGSGRGRRAPRCAIRRARTSRGSSSAVVATRSESSKRASEAAKFPDMYSSAPSVRSSVNDAPRARGSHAWHRAPHREDCGVPGRAPRRGGCGQGALGGGSEVGPTDPAVRAHDVPLDPDVGRQRETCRQCSAELRPPGLPVTPGPRHRRRTPCPLRYGPGHATRARSRPASRPRTASCSWCVLEGA